MRTLRIAALVLLPLAGACWMERPNLGSTGGGYAAAVTASRPAGAGAPSDTAETRRAPLSP
jgi:hypothetical protein